MQAANFMVTDRRMDRHHRMSAVTLSAHACRGLITSKVDRLFLLIGTWDVRFHCACIHGPSSIIGNIGKGHRVIRCTWSADLVGQS